MRERLKILLLSSNEADTVRLEDTLGKHAILVTARNLEHVWDRLEDSHYDALLCGWTFENGTWKEALKEVRQRSPELPIIVLSPRVREQEWLEVVEAGAFDLLAAPYGEYSILSMAEHAVASREARAMRSAY